MRIRREYLGNLVRVSSLLRSDGGIIGGFSRIFKNTNPSQIVRIEDGNIDASGTITAGGGLDINGKVSITGTIELNNGDFIMGAQGPTGIAGDFLINDGGKFIIDGAGPSGPGGITVSGGGDISITGGGGIIIDDAGELTMNGGTLTIGDGPTGLPGSLLLEGDSGILISGGDFGMTGGGNMTLGTGTDIFMGQNGDINLGTGGDVNLGTNGNVNLGTGGDVNLSNGNITIDDGGGITISNSGGTAGNITLNDNGNIILNNGSDMNINDSGSINITGTGGIDISGGNINTNGGDINTGSGDLTTDNATVNGTLNVDLIGPDDAGFVRTDGSFRVGNGGAGHLVVEGTAEVQGATLDILTSSGSGAAVRLNEDGDVRAIGDVNIGPPSDINVTISSTGNVTAEGNFVTNNGSFSGPSGIFGDVNVTNNIVAGGSFSGPSGIFDSVVTTGEIRSNTTIFAGSTGTFGAISVPGGAGATDTFVEITESQIEFNRNDNSRSTLIDDVGIAMNSSRLNIMDTTGGGIVMTDSDILLNGTSGITINGAGDIGLNSGDIDMDVNASGTKGDIKNVGSISRELVNYNYTTTLLSTDSDLGTINFPDSGSLIVFRPINGTPRDQPYTLTINVTNSAIADGTELNLFFIGDIGEDGGLLPHNITITFTGSSPVLVYGYDTANGSTTMQLNELNRSARLVFLDNFINQGGTNYDVFIGAGDFSV